VRLVLLMLSVAVSGIFCDVSLFRELTKNDLEYTKYKSQSAVVNAIGKDGVAYQIKLADGTTLEMISKYNQYKVGDVIPHINDVHLPYIDNYNEYGSDWALIVGGIILTTCIVLILGGVGIVCGFSEAELFYSRRNNKRNVYVKRLLP